MKKDGDMSFRRILGSRWALFASVLLCAFIFFQTIKVVSKGAATDKEIMALKGKSNTLLEERKKLEQLQQFLQTDYFAESEARTKFGYKKIGETAVIISENSRTTLQSENNLETHDGSPVAADKKKNQGNSMALWWGYFFGAQ